MLRPSAFILRRERAAVNRLGVIGNFVGTRRFNSSNQLSTTSIRDSAMPDGDPGTAAATIRPSGVISKLRQYPVLPIKAGTALTAPVANVGVVVTRVTNSVAARAKKSSGLVSSWV